jgi:integrase
MQKIRFTAASIARLKPKGTRYLVRNANLAGHYLRIYPTGNKTHYALTRDPSGQQVWQPVGDPSLLKPEEAEELARIALKAIKSGHDRAGPESFQVVAEEWFQRHVMKRGLRSHAHTRYYLDRHILPQWTGREFTTIRRRDVTALLDKVEDGSGPVAADKALAIVSNIMNWYATRSDDYSSPLIKGMRRSNPKERARTRILDDDELRMIWKVAEGNGEFGVLVRLLLLTGQRRDKVASMRWEDVQDGVWTIPAESREKGNAEELPLPQLALEIIDAQPRFAGSSFVIARKNYHTKAKADFVAKLPPMPQWQLHDLRRTARSLLARAGIRPDIAERVLGHAIQGVEGTYNRHQYTEEKAHALRALAGLIANILNPSDTVVSLSRTKAL